MIGRQPVILFLRSLSSQSFATMPDVSRTQAIAQHTTNRGAILFHGWNLVNHLSVRAGFAGHGRKLRGGLCATLAKATAGVEIRGVRVAVGRRCRHRIAGPDYAPARWEA